MTIDSLFVLLYTFFILDHKLCGMRINESFLFRTKEYPDMFVSNLHVWDLHGLIISPAIPLPFRSFIKRPSIGNRSWCRGRHIRDGSKIENYFTQRSFIYDIKMHSNHGLKAAMTQMIYLLGRKFKQFWYGIWCRKA